MKKYFSLCLLFIVSFALTAYGEGEKFYEGSAEGVKAIQSASLEANKKLKANGFLLSEEIEEIWEAEKTPDVLEKLSVGIENELERSICQDGVLSNKVLKATRAIAKKYGIKAGDIFTIQFHSISSE